MSNIQTVILDAGPLITQPAAQLKQFANEYYTTPGVYAELKDEQVRQQLILWGDALKVLQPKQEYINQVNKFAKLTGDYNVLSMNDIHIIALALQFEIEKGKGEPFIRKYPGEILEHQKSETKDDTVQEILKDDDGFITIPKQKGRKRGGKRQREKREAEAKRLMEQAQNGEINIKIKESDKNEEPIEQQDEKSLEPAQQQEEDLAEQQEDQGINIDSDDDGDWITPENLQQEMIKDSTETIQDSKLSETTPLFQAALATGDFACQNVAMQININLLNTMSGKQIKRIRNYMYRCHACFKLTPISKDGKPKHFCPKCGGNTLLRCAVSIDNNTGKITPHLKQNFQYIKRGDKFSLPSPLSKNQIKKQGNGGFQHNKENRHKSLQNPLILREDQKEYDQAMKNDDWERRQNEKLLQEWIGGGSADNVMSPFGTMNIKHSGVNVGKGRYVNSSRGKKK